MLIPKTPKTQSQYDWKELIGAKQRQRGMIQAYVHILSRTWPEPAPATLAKAIWEELQFDQILHKMHTHYQLTGEHSKWEGKPKQFGALCNGSQKGAFEIAIQDEKFAQHWHKWIDRVERNTQANLNRGKEKNKQPKLDLA